MAPCPHFTDSHALEIILINRKELHSAGAGEAPIITIAPAIANSSQNAIGVRSRSLRLAAAGPLSE